MRQYILLFKPLCYGNSRKLIQVRRLERNHFRESSKFGRFEKINELSLNNVTNDRQTHELKPKMYLTSFFFLPPTSSQVSGSSANVVHTCQLLRVGKRVKRVESASGRTKGRCLEHPPTVSLTSFLSLPLPTLNTTARGTLLCLKPSNLTRKVLTGISKVKRVWLAIASHLTS